MVNQQALASHWSEVCDQIQEKWEHISADDLPSFPGNVEQLVGKIQQKTGESREAIEEFLSTVSDEGHDLAADAKQRLSEGAEQLKQTARRGAERLKDGYAEAGHLVERNPAQSIAVAFGLGLVCGLGVALVMRGRPAPPTRMERGRAAGRRFAEHFREAAATYMPHR